MDRYEIKAEIVLSRSTLADIARAAHIPESSCRGALLYPIPVANRAIAKHLGKTVHEMWPQWFDEQGDRIPGTGSRTRRVRRTSRNRGAK